MSTYITPLDPGPGRGPRLAVKDLVDVAGVPTTAGSRAVAETGEPASTDAACLAGARAAGARITGKANLFELAYGASGVNEWFGTPCNPLDPDRVPGGSSSGSAVAVATGTAEVAYGSDTGGSIRVPSAFCGTAGLKTTHGRVALEGVWPLAPSLDTVGPMARGVAGLVLGMQLLEPGFRDEAAAAGEVGRLRVPEVAVDPVIDAAVDAALAGAGLAVVEVGLPGWAEAHRWAGVLLDREARRANRRLTDDPATASLLGAAVRARLSQAGRLTASDEARARAFRAGWVAEVGRALARVPLLALPTVAFFPPRLEEARGPRYTTLTNPVNLAGLPALSLPVPAAAYLPAGLQLVGPPGGEDLLLATARRIEAAVPAR